MSNPKSIPIKVIHHEDSQAKSTSSGGTASPDSPPPIDESYPEADALLIKLGAWEADLRALADEMGRKKVELIKRLAEILSSPVGPKKEE